MATLSPTQFPTQPPQGGSNNNEDELTNTEQHPEIVVGPILGFVLVAAIIVIILCLFIKRQRRREEMNMLRDLMEAKNRNGSNRSMKAVDQSHSRMHPILPPQKDISARGTRYDLYGTSTTNRAVGKRAERDYPLETEPMRVKNEYKKIKIRDFRKGSLLGKGAYGEVHLGLELATGRLMAVKSVPITKIQKASLASFLSEVNLLKELIHPNVVQLYDAKTDKQILYIFLEYVSGGSLSSLLKQFGVLTPELAGVFTRQILQGLDYLHENGIAHRDIKGGNILTTQDGLVKIADFGVSCKLEKTQARGFKKNFSVFTLAGGGGGALTAKKTGLHGTPPFMAPEVVRQSGAGAPADVWSLGCTVIEMLTGRAPWVAYHRSVPSVLLQIAETKEPPPEVEKLEGLARSFVLKCCIIEADYRPTATQLLYHPFVSTKQERQESKARLQAPRRVKQRRSNSGGTSEGSPISARNKARGRTRPLRPQSGDKEEKQGGAETKRDNIPVIVRLTSISSNMNASGLLDAALKESERMALEAKNKLPNPTQSPRHPGNDVKSGEGLKEPNTDTSGALSSATFNKALAKHGEAKSLKRQGSSTQKKAGRTSLETSGAYEEPAGKVAGRIEGQSGSASIPAGERNSTPIMLIQRMPGDSLFKTPDTVEKGKAQAVEGIQSSKTNDGDKNLVESTKVTASTCAIPEVLDVAVTMTTGVKAEDGNREPPEPERVDSDLQKTATGVLRTQTSQVSWGF
eukprot:CAMPEP_0184491160 /NCGR_PEP_ID=MMETSP0113_2-20130426/19727_1 /TAXON_ID=91329 /ORGANISM="Norrisiella sphaerica, Strain BC52" /LENGTH=743 /DNA_ID=CAMNT_0026875409 /DNA_START=87 /DNA_END=2318 /DNA_ORIENTATION=-